MVVSHICINKKTLVDITEQEYSVNGEEHRSGNENGEGNNHEPVPVGVTGQRTKKGSYY